MSARNYNCRLRNKPNSLLRHDAANSPFSQICEHTLKINIFTKTARFYLCIYTPYSFSSGMYNDREWRKPVFQTPYQMQYLTSCHTITNQNSEFTIWMKSFRCVSVYSLYHYILPSTQLQYNIMLMQHVSTYSSHLQAKLRTVNALQGGCAHLGSDMAYSVFVVGFLRT